MSASVFHDPVATWNQRYSQESYLFGTEPSRWLVSQRAWLPPNGRVLAVADGEGRNSVWMASQGLKVDAFDISEVAVAKARRLAATRGVDVRHAVMDADAVQWPRAVYDAAVAIFIQFADPAARQRLFRRCAAALKPGGVFLLHGYTPRQLEYRTGGPPIRSHFFTEDQLREELAGLSIELVEEFEDQLSEGSGHSGQSALIGLVARRR